MFNDENGKQKLIKKTLWESLTVKLLRIKNIANSFETEQIFYINALNAFTLHFLGQVSCTLADLML
jgi:hypothetical protein